MTRIIRALVVFLGAAGAAGWGLYEKFGPFWPTEPNILPGQAAAVESSPVPPFTVGNKSVVFPIEGGRFTCFLNAALFKIGDEKGWTLARVGPTHPGTWWKKSEDTAIRILPGKTVNYFCGSSEMIRDVRLNGEPARLRGMQVRISMDYEVNFPLYVWHRHFDSDVFTCDVDAGSCRWFIGELIH